MIRYENDVPSATPAILINARVSAARDHARGIERIQRQKDADNHATTTAGTERGTRFDLVTFEGARVCRTFGSEHVMC